MADFLAYLWDTVIGDPIRLLAAVGLLAIVGWIYEWQERKHRETPAEMEARLRREVKAEIAEQKRSRTVRAWFNQTSHVPPTRRSVGIRRPARPTGEAPSYTDLIR